MKKIVLRNVGDGLNLIISNKTRHDLIVDFGGDMNLNCPWVFQSSFLLSHFHADHYRGILNCRRHHCYWDLENFYYPEMPSFSEAKHFYMCLWAMNIRISKNHPIQNTIFEYVRRLNIGPLKFIPVSKGDVILCGGRKYEILWPPKILHENEVLADIRKAINDFEEAKASDRELGEIYQNISRKYPETGIINELGIINNEEDFRIKEFDGELSEFVNKANNSLRKAANRLSIAFRQDDNILFLGDLESSEIKSVVTDLVANNNVIYDIMIAPHHGTHWHRSLTSISADLCLVSVGQKLKAKIKKEYKGICKRFVRTDEWGDLKLRKRSPISWFD